MSSQKNDKAWKLLENAARPEGSSQRQVGRQVRPSCSKIAVSVSQVERVVRVLENLLLWRVAPKQIRMDNGPEFISKRLENWAKEKQIVLMHIQPRKPAHIVPMSFGRMPISNASTARFVKTF